MSDEITASGTSAEIELIASSGGVFEVHRDGELIYSKRRKLRLPRPGEIPELLGLD